MTMALSKTQLKRVKAAGIKWMPCMDIDAPEFVGVWILSGPKKITKIKQELFEHNAFIIHEGEYTYEKAVYVNYDTKLIITHPELGDHEITPGHHLNGKGIPKCEVHDLESFVRKATEVHKGEYSYEKAVYNGAFEKLIITHPYLGDHLIEPANHLQGNGHPRVHKPVRDRESFIEAATEKHDGLYTYEKAVYNGATTKLIITHPELGDHLISPDSHLSGTGHPRVHSTVHDLESFIKAATEKHNGLYTYEKAAYINTGTKLTITHPEHGDHLITPNKHLQGQGHPNVERDYNPRSFIYLVEFECEQTGDLYYKIGKTEDKSGFRRNDTKNYIITNVTTFPISTEVAPEIEREVLARARNEFGCLEKPPKSPITDGGTELFVFDPKAEEFFNELGEEYSATYPPKEDDLVE